MWYKRISLRIHRAFLHLTFLYCCMTASIDGCRETNHCFPCNVPGSSRSDFARFCKSKRGRGCLGYSSAVYELQHFATFPNPMIVSLLNINHSSDLASHSNPRWQTLPHSRHLTRARFRKINKSYHPLWILATSQCGRRL